MYGYGKRNKNNFYNRSFKSTEQIQISSLEIKIIRIYNKTISHTCIHGRIIRREVGNGTLKTN